MVQMELKEETELKKIFFRGNKINGGFILIQTVLLIFVFSVLFGFMVEVYRSKILLLEKKSCLLKDKYQIQEVIDENK